MGEHPTEHTGLAGKRLRQALALVAGITLQQTASADWAFYSEAESFNYSEPVSAYQAAKDWEDEFDGGDLAFTYNRLEVGIAWKGLRLGYLARYDYRLHFAEDAARFYYEQENDLEPTVGKNYSLDIDALHQRSQGLVVHYDWQVREDLRLTPSLVLLYANDMIDARLRGQAGYEGNDIYRGQITADYYYLDDILFERNIQDTGIRGMGYSLDIAAHWQPTANWQLSLKTHDLLAAIHWHDLPHTSAVADTEPVQTDDPFERYRDSAVRGRESERSRRQQLPTRVQLQGRYQQGAMSLMGELYHEPDQTFFLPAVGYRLAQWELALVAEPWVQALGIRLRHPWLSATLISDSADYQKAHFFKAHLSLHVAF